MSTMCWNCHRAASKSFKRVLKLLIHLNKPNMVVLLEPRISGIQADIAITSFGLPFSHRVEAQGLSGGIWVLWNEEWKVEVVRNHRQFIHLHIFDSKMLLIEFIAIYGHPVASQRAFLWPELNSLVSSNSISWLLGGDFNALLHPSDRKGGSLNKLGVCKLFSNWFKANDMHDLGFKGPTFTWSRGSLWERLDRAICNTTWRLNFPEASIFYLAKIKYDLRPILIRIA
ncbi:hypothetical protein P3X46_007769 [Hevea brasiliensis]|uniref:Endonuclease/exonuclease/phosphatase domain-containing protein n=1 Tax=Hevea brasiliensis TaxID=3981 RepID=A0ABQ9MUJ4_HEVBR|nr:hypothetical protein P3X46_007769 [Hevea brasiliensis]